MFVLRKHPGSVFQGFPGVDLDPVTRSESGSRNFLSRIPPPPPASTLHPPRGASLFILHSLQPAAARLHCSAAASIVRPEPGLQPWAPLERTRLKNQARVFPWQPWECSISLWILFLQLQSDKKSIFGCVRARLPLRRVIRPTGLPAPWGPVGSVRGTGLHVWLRC